MFDLFSLKGKNALVTGSQTGLGAGMAVGLAQAGANVVVHGINTKGIAEVCEAVRAAGARPVEAVADVSDALRAQGADRERYLRVHPVLPPRCPVLNGR